MSKNKSEYLINRKDNQYEVVIGLEVHAQVTSDSKLFSTSSTKFGAEPNTQVSLVDAAFPGMLPVINEFCVKQAIKTGIGLNAKINKRSVFDRKNYFYADLPQGYQISQFKDPIVGEGKVILDMPEGQKEVGIERLHLEQDAGKSIHDIDPDNTLVDLNRSGVALMEIVSKPDLRSPDEVSAYIKKLRSIMRYLGTCDGNMQEGSLRADVNVSVRLKGSKDFGTRCEIKNVNSIKFMQSAIDYEANRQVDLIEEGKIIDQETRLFDTKKNETRSMRSKEDAHDYRYFPDPDLLPLEVSDEFIEKLKSDIPELPDDKKKRFINEFKLSPYEATILVSDIEIAKYFEQVVAKMGKNRDIKLAVNWITGELFALLNSKNLEISQSPISAKNLSILINLIKNGTISGKIAKTVFEHMIDGDQDPQKIVQEKGLKQQSDPKALEALIDKIINDNREKAIEYKNGKEKLFGFFVGQAMKASGGKANPQLINEILKKNYKVMGADLNITKLLQDYILKYGLKLHPVQKEIINYNLSLGDIKRMQISISQCQFLHLIIKVSKIKRVLEIGTFTGLSTLSMALALPEDGEITAVDKDKNTSKKANEFFKKAKQDSKISIIVKSALEALMEIRDKKYELIFIDADKMSYKKYYEIALKLLDKEGLIIIDNVLWHGDVVESNIKDKITDSIRDLNNFISKDERVEKVIVPFGDGMTICRKL